MDDDPLPWPIPPIWPEDVANIRALLTDEEWADLERRLVHLSDGPGRLEQRAANAHAELRLCGNGVRRSRL